MKPSEIPYLHVRPTKRTVGMGCDPEASIVGNKAGLLALRDLIDRALRADEGMASVGDGYREVDERRYDVMVQRADRREQMGEPREPERPDRSMFT